MQTITPPPPTPSPPTQYKIIIYDKAYTKYQLYDNATNDPIDQTTQHVDPIQQKRFSEDVFSETGNLLYSKIRTAPAIPGVLILENNRTYGRTANQKRLFYRCALYDPTLPDFIIAYSPTSHEFSKNPKNLFVLFKFDQWIGKHPEGVLIKTIGEVDDLAAYYEYRLYCKGLIQHNGKMNQYIYQTLRQQPPPSHTLDPALDPDPPGAEGPQRHIFTIDPECTTTYDDALELSYRVIDPDTTTTTTPHRIALVSVHISDVAATIDQLSLWDQLAEHIQIPVSIYMPDKRHSLLPPLLETKCSLTQNAPHKHVITTTFHIDLFTHTVIQTDISTTTITVQHNYVYESPELFRDTHYITLYDITRKLAAAAATDAPPHPTNSTELVEYWMLQTNTHIAAVLKSHQSGIFRTVKRKCESTKPKIRDGMHEQQREWNTYHYGKYQLYDPNHSLSHDALQLSQYVHITSPIRRLVDILNQITLYDIDQERPTKLSPNSLNFLKKWSTDSEMNVLNQQMRNIQKIQSECELLARFTEHPERLEMSYRGIIMDGSENRITIYLYDLRLFCFIKTDREYEIHSEHAFKIYLFKDENTFHKKIRVCFSDDA
jgi:exoribonuclease R